MITRRSLFGILAGAVAAPIVVREGLIMPVKALAVPEIVVDISMIGDGTASGLRVYTLGSSFNVVGREFLAAVKREWDAGRVLSRQDAA